MQSHSKSSLQNWRSKVWIITVLVVSAGPAFGAALRITGQPAGYAGPGNVALKLEVQTDPTNADCQWLRNGAPLEGATSHTLDLGNIKHTDGGTYSVIVSIPEQAHQHAEALISDAAVVRTTDYLFPLRDDFTGRLRTNSTSGIIQSDNLSAGEGLPEEPQHADEPPSKSVWLEWMAPADGVAVLDTEGSSFDTRLAIYDSKPNPHHLKDLDAVASDNDSGPAFTSRTAFNAKRNKSYYVAVDGKAIEYDMATNGYITLNWKFTAGVSLPVIKHHPKSKIVKADPARTVTFDVKMKDGKSDDYDFVWLKNGVSMGVRSESVTVAAILDNVAVYSARVKLKTGVEYVTSRGAALSLKDPVVRPGPRGVIVMVTGPNSGTLICPINSFTNKANVCGGGTFDRYNVFFPFYGKYTTPSSGALFPNSGNYPYLDIDTFFCAHAGLDTAVQVNMAVSPYTPGTCANDSPFPMTIVCNPVPAKLTKCTQLLTNYKTYRTVIYFKMSTLPAGLTSVSFNWLYHP